MLTIAASAETTGSAWPMFRHDLRHTGRTPFTGPAVPVVRWTFPTNDAIASSPTLGSDGTIYVGSGFYFSGIDPNLYAINPDGSLKWKFLTGGSIFSSPAIGPDGTIYVGSMDRNLYAVEDSITYGKLKWAFLQGLSVYSSPAIGANGTIYVGGLDFNCYALNPDGSLKWKYMTGWCVFSSPAVGSEGEIYYGSKDHNLYAFDDSSTDATVRWSAPFGVFYDGHLVDSSPAIGPDGTIYVGTDPYGASGQTPVPADTVFFAVNPDGSIKWKFVMEDGTESSPAIGPDGMIYIGSYDGNLYAIRDDGDAPVLEWVFPTRGAIDGSPTVDGCGTIYVGSRDSTLYAINPDGSMRWSVPTGGGIESSPTIDENGILYIGSFDGNLYAIGAGGPDVGVDSIRIPDEVYAGAAYTPGAVVQNYRAGAQSFEVACLIDAAGASVYEDTVSVTGLVETAPHEVSFKPWTTGQDTAAVYTITVIALHDDDENRYNDTLSAEVRAVSEATADAGGEGAGSLPPYALKQCYPNPFNPATTIRFGLQEAAHARLRIYDVSGRFVRSLVDGFRSAGAHSEIWNGTDDAGRAVASGVYFYRLQAGAFTETRKMVLLR